mgnify:FL=1
MGKKKKQKKFDKVKSVKKLSRDMFIDIPTSTQVHTDKKKYSRKQKHKKRLDDE